MNQPTEYNKLHKDQFILGWYIDKEICKKMIDLFQSLSHHHQPGKLGVGVVDETRKKSTDILFGIPSQNSVICEYLNNLSQCVDLYKKEYTVLQESFSPWAAQSDFAIQWYKPNESYSKLHCERSSYKTTNRMLVFMTYLNTVTDGGETEFVHQNLKVQPEEGLTLIWPSDFTHMHRGIPSPSQHKYIATGWYVFTPPEV